MWATHFWMWSLVRFRTCLLGMCQNQEDLNPMWAFERQNSWRWGNKLRDFVGGFMGYNITNCWCYPVCTSWDSHLAIFGKLHLTPPETLITAETLPSQKEAGSSSKHPFSGVNSPLVSGKVNYGRFQGFILNSAVWLLRFLPCLKQDSRDSRLCIDGLPFTAVATAPWVKCGQLQQF